MPKLCLVTLGCPKNIVEGEHIAGLLESKGWTLTTDILHADTAVVHTCSFIADAKKESEEAIKAFSAIKRSKRLRLLAVTGCLAQREGSAFKERFPEIDVIAGTGAEAIRALPSALGAGRGVMVSKPGGFLDPDTPRLLSSTLPSAYLRVAEGCNHKCGFCVIPSLRGRYHSRRRENIIREAKGLAACGVKEIILIAQDTTLYGKDLYGTSALPALMESMAAIEGIKWVRLMYAFPSTLTPATVKAIRGNDKICKYIDMPVQHTADSVLKRMGRPAGVKKLVRGLKEMIPGLTLRSTLITGFPGETESEFKEVCAFVSEGWFDQLGVFEYSPMPGTPASRLRGAVSDRVKKERKKTLMLIQKNVVKRKFRCLKGKTFEAVVEARNGDGTFMARISMQAPEIDGGLIIRGKCAVGSFVKVKITGFRGYDLLGETL